MGKLTVEELLKNESYEGIVTGVPTGMYADRESYGNAPMLVFILDEELPCKIRARPYSHRYKADEGVDETRDQLAFETLIDKVINVEFDNENEKLGIAAAFVDQAIRNSYEIEVHGKYESNLFIVDYLKVNNFGFEFLGYEFGFEMEDNE